MHEVSLCCVTISITYHNSNSMYLFYMFIESVMYGVRKVIKIQSKAPFLTKLEWHIKLKGDQIVFGAREMDHFNKKGSRYKKQVLTQVIFLFAVGRCEDCHNVCFACSLIFRHISMIFPFKLHFCDKIDATGMIVVVT